jgi:hypothetical protein
VLIYFPDWKDAAGPPLPEFAKDTTKASREHSPRPVGHYSHIPLTIDTIDDSKSLEFPFVAKMASKNPRNLDVRSADNYCY